MGRAGDKYWRQTASMRKWQEQLGLHRVKAYWPKGGTARTEKGEKESQTVIKPWVFHSIGHALGSGP